MTSQGKFVEGVPVYILSGGQSRRFQDPGRPAQHMDKARYVVDGAPLIRHVAEAARPVARSITAVAAEVGRYEDLGIRTIADLLPVHGPLGGIDAALHDAPAGWILVLSCDWYGLRTQWLRTLLDAREDALQAVLYEDAKHLQPLIAAYHTDAAPALRAILEAGQLNLGAAVRTLPHRVLPAPEGWETLCNVNRRDDLLGA